MTSNSSKRKKKAKKRKASKVSEEAEENGSNTPFNDAEPSKSGEGDTHQEKRQKQDADDEHDASEIVHKRDASLFGSGDGNASEATEIRKVMGIVSGQGDATDNAKETIVSKSKPSSDFCFGFAVGEEGNSSPNAPCSNHTGQEESQPTGELDGSHHAEGSTLNHRVYVGGMPFSLSEEEVREFWSECGEVKAVQCLTFPDTKKFRGIAYVTFSTDEGYQKALASNGEYADGFELKVKPWASYASRNSDSKNEENGFKAEILGEKSKGYNVAFVCNLPYDMTAESIKDIFADIGVDYVRLHTKEGTSESRGFAHIHFSTEDLLDKAVAKDGMVVKDRIIRVGYAKPRDEEKEKPSKWTPPELKVDLTNKCSTIELGDVGTKLPSIHAIHVANLPYMAMEEDIRRLFKDYPIQRILLPTKGENHSNIGVCIVEFTDAALCKNAIQINGAQFGGRHVALRYAKRRDLSKFRIMVAKFAGQNGQKRGKAKDSAKKIQNPVEEKVHNDGGDMELDDDPLMALL